MIFFQEPRYALGFVSIIRKYLAEENYSWKPLLYYRDSE